MRKASLIAALLFVSTLATGISTPASAAFKYEWNWATCVWFGRCHDVIVPDDLDVVLRTA